MSKICTLVGVFALSLSCVSVQAEELANQASEGEYQYGECDVSVCNIVAGRLTYYPSNFSRAFRSEAHQRFLDNYEKYKAMSEQGRLTFEPVKINNAFSALDRG